MKTKNTLFVLALIMAACYSSAQGPTIGFQGRTFLNINSYGTESINDIGYGGGIAGFFPFGEKWALRPEFNLQNRRYVQREESTQNNATYTSVSKSKDRLRSTYLDIPIVVRYQSKSRFGFSFGPQFGWNIGSHSRYESESKLTYLLTGDIEETSSTSNGPSSSDGFMETSFLMGVGYKFDFGMAIDFRIQRTIFMFAGNYGLEWDRSWTLLSLGLKYDLPMGKTGEE